MTKVQGGLKKFEPLSSLKIIFPASISNGNKSCDWARWRPHTSRDLKFFGGNDCGQ